MKSNLGPSPLGMFYFFLQEEEAVQEEELQEEEEQQVIETWTRNVKACTCDCESADSPTRIPPSFSPATTLPPPPPPDHPLNCMPGEGCTSFTWSDLACIDVWNGAGYPFLIRNYNCVLVDTMSSEIIGVASFKFFFQVSVGTQNVSRWCNRSQSWCPHVHSAYLRPHALQWWAIPCRVFSHTLSIK